MVKAQHNGSGMQAALGDMTCQRFALEYYLPQPQRTKHSWNVDAHIIHKHLLPILGDRPMITRDKLLDTQHWLQANGLTPRTCERILFCPKAISSE